jgi:hypothetical protein
MEERVEHCEEIGKVEGYAHPNDGPLRFRKDRAHDGSLFICWSSREGGCPTGTYQSECSSRKLIQKEDGGRRVQDLK